MEEKYNNLIKDFNNLDIEDKQEEIKDNLYELLKLLYFANKRIDDMNKMLPIYNEYNSEDEYYNLLFSYIISLKEENAKLIEKLQDSDLI